MEHLQHFGLRRDPFCNEPIPDHFLEIAPHRDALRRLTRGVHQRRGLCVLSGQVGSGKTTAVRQLLETLEEELFEASMMVVLNASADAAWIMTRFAKQLGIEEPPPEREALLAQIYEQLAIVREDSRHAVLIIDDAEALAAGRVLADVCGLLKLEYEDRRLLTLVLAGGPPLEAALAAEPGLAARIEVKVRLEALDRPAARDYLMRRIQGAGGTVSIVGQDAMDAIHGLGQGLPGRMNTLADNALFEAFLASRTEVTRTDVERAHRDLGWSACPPPAGQPSRAAEPVPTPPRREAAGARAAGPLARTGTGAAFAGAEAVGGADGAGFSGSGMPLEALDSELDAAFAIGPSHGLDPLGDSMAQASFAAIGRDVDGPPKDDDEEVQDLLVELIED